jgi:hypothetical protein
MFEVAVYGDFPTIDKQGSMLFYLDGVHERLTFHPIASLVDPAAQLIGVHVGHLWMVAGLDLLLSPHGAMNALSLLLPAVAWWAVALLLRELKVAWEWALALALPFGLGLHLFRDINWYTIEKAAVFWLPLFLIALLRAYRRGGRWHIYAAGCFTLMAFTNWYLALVAGAGLAFAQLLMLRDTKLWRTSLYCGLMVLPLAVLQFALMSNAPHSDPQLYLDQRAALDIFSIGELQWNRLPIWRAVELLGFSYGIFSAYRHWDSMLIRLLAIVAGGLFLFSLGPHLYGSVPNPFFMASWHLVPGFWRVAKPEVFFYGAWLLVLSCSAYGLSQNSRLNTVSSRMRVMIYCASLLWWVCSVRSHEVFPGFSLPVETDLAEVWQAHLN